MANDRHKRYQKARAGLINQALKITREYIDSLGLYHENERNDMFNRVFLHTMDQLAYESGLTHIPPKRMSHEIDNINRFEHRKAA
jgi:hypothetical protein